MALWYTASFIAAKKSKSLRYCGVFEGESFTCGFSLDCTNFHILAHSMVWSKACSCKKPPRHNCLLTFTIIYYFLSKKYFYSIIIECLTSLQFYLCFQYEKKNSEDMNPADDASFCILYSFTKCWTLSLNENYLILEKYF